MSSLIKKIFYSSIKNLWFFMILGAIIIIVASISRNRRTDLTEVVADNMQKNIVGRLEKLEDYMKEVSEADSSHWVDLDKFPDDMVIYRYVNDSLKSWHNQFAIDNDDITRRIYVRRFINIRSSLDSPLSEIGEEAEFLSLGPKWYIARKVINGTVTVIGGLEIKNTLDNSSFNGVNPRLGLSDRFSVYPISYSGGVPIIIEGQPLMKIIQENSQSVPLMPSSFAIWFALFLLIIGILQYLSGHRGVADFVLSIVGVTSVVAIFFLIGKGVQSVSDMFSPTIYASGQFFYSLGAVLLVNIWIVSVILALYLMRMSLFKVLEKYRSPKREKIFVYSILALIAIIAVYTHLTLRSIILNSNITLELYKINEISIYTVFVYTSYIALLMTFVLLLQMIQPIVRRHFRLRYNMFDRNLRLLWSLLAASYLLAMTSIIGYNKELKRVEIWANRLSVDRNIGFELRIKRMEMAIANDPVLSALIPMEGEYGTMVFNRISETYLNKISQDYEASLLIQNDKNPINEAAEYYLKRIEAGVAIADSSHFVYQRSPNGRSQYTGMFTFVKPGNDVIRLFIGLDSKLEKDGTGYSAILGSTRTGSVVMPPIYSYAKYISDRLVSYRGDYPYPTVLSGDFKDFPEGGKTKTLTVNKNTHFFTKISDNEVIVISRKNVDIFRYLVAGFLISILAYLLVSIPSLRKKSIFEKNYYKTRINTVLYFSLVATLIAMGAISVIFVYRRNETNVINIMIGKINTIQSLIESSTGDFISSEDFSHPAFSTILENIGAYTRSDISIYNIEGKEIKSTYPEIFEKRFLGTRLNEKAFENIMYRNRRYYIHKEKLNGKSYYAMYAPILNDEGNKMGVVCAPYTDSGIEFRDEGYFHAIFIITVFFILMIITRILSSTVIDRMFRPLIEMGVKMNYARTAGLEYIIYDREDEISSLVRSYNLMVHDLTESTKKLTLAERDKAWSEMARQVAHEIKNPLTPIKLQIQRIIRLRQKNDPAWQDKFDTIVPIIMESIEELTDTANEFSTFAKLYSEEPVLINIDELAASQVALFDEKENIRIQYIGLQGAKVMGPKPQITRVFVNLLANAVQAIENQQKEDAENGKEPKKGYILLSVRNSTKDGFYDVVVEDNGPGVKDENRNRLFTPNFTTKSSGTGLGLAICKNIIERSGGEIFYSKSFALQGACFTFRIPKANV